METGGNIWKVACGFYFQSTSVIEIRGQKPLENLLKSRKYIMAIWHSRILLVSYLFKGTNASILVSRSDDGEIIARILQAQGQKTVRGSTKKVV
jgi:lysophospholipid acyltransferase (LPLAT)-like uncharacterized protein